MANSANKFLRSENKKDILIAEEKLWRSVMATAVFDALHLPSKYAGKYKTFYEKKHIRAAREWFLNKEGTFSFVCETLDLDEEHVHKTMKSKIKQMLFQEKLVNIREGDTIE